tara:strand:+ start:43 stop:504 length:462 start_codon:yes stop_codon:yes gene_type:complete
MKTCNDCKASKDTVDFYKNRTYADGLQSRCKVCSKQKAKTYYIDNKVKVKAYQVRTAPNIKTVAKKYRAVNADRFAAQYGAGNAVNRGGVLSEIYNVDLCRPVYAEARRLTKETGILHHVDHIKPLNKGGLHCQTNIQVLTATENQVKGDLWM